MARTIILLMDSFGIGSAHDAADFGDKGSDTLGHIAEWFVENQICKTKNVESARAGLKKARSAKGNGLYYGYLIENI